MQTTKYIEILDLLVERLELKKLVHILGGFLHTHPSHNPPLGPDKEVLVEKLFKAREELSFQTRDKDTARVAEALGLLAALSVDAINRALLILAKNDVNQVREPNQFRALYQVYAPTKAVLDQQRVLHQLISSERIVSVDKTEEVLEFEVLQLGQQGFDLDRIAHILPSIDKLFKGVAEGLNLAAPSVSIVYTDSGSGMIVAVKAVASLVGEIRKFLVDVLGQVRDWRADQFSSRLAAATEALEFCERVKANENAGVLTAEQSKRATHNAVTAASDLLERGTILREMQLPREHTDIKFLEAVAVKALPSSQSVSAPPALKF